MIEKSWNFHTVTGSLCLPMSSKAVLPTLSEYLWKNLEIRFLKDFGHFCQNYFWHIIGSVGNTATQRYECVLTKIETPMKQSTSELEKSVVTSEETMLISTTEISATTSVTGEQVTEPFTTSSPSIQRVTSSPQGTLRMTKEPPSTSSPTTQRVTSSPQVTLKMTKEPFTTSSTSTQSVTTTFQVTPVTDRVTTTPQVKETTLSSQSVGQEVTSLIHPTSVTSLIQGKTETTQVISPGSTTELSLVTDVPPPSQIMKPGMTSKTPQNVKETISEVTPTGAHFGTTPVTTFKLKEETNSQLKPLKKGDKTVFFVFLFSMLFIVLCLSLGVIFTYRYYYYRRSQRSQTIYPENESGFEMKTN